MYRNFSQQIILENKNINELINFLEKNIRDADENYKNIIKSQINSINNQGLISEIVSLKYDNKIIAYKLFLKNSNRIPDNCIPAWHGTLLENLEPIIKYGFHLPNTKLPNGEMTPQTDYIPLKDVVLGIRNWEKAIFASPNLTCASMYSFYKPVHGYQYPHCASLIEIRIKPEGFTEYHSDDVIRYVGGHGHPYGTVYHDNIIYRIENEKNIEIKSIAFINNDFVRDMREPYNDYEGKSGKILEKPDKLLEDLNNLFS